VPNCVTFHQKPPKNPPKPCHYRHRRHCLSSFSRFLVDFVGLYRTSRPVRKSGKFSKSGLSGNLPGCRTFNTREKKKANTAHATIARVHLADS
jgi:hypothetical protein